ncbi:unnamed protein product, partial [Prorocentrum cordatum]
ARSRRPCELLARPCTKPWPPASGSNRLGPCSAGRRRACQTTPFARRPWTCERCRSSTSSSGASGGRRSRSPSAWVAQKSSSRCRPRARGTLPAPWQRTTQNTATQPTTCRPVSPNARSVATIPAEARAPGPSRCCPHGHRTGWRPTSCGFFFR